MWPFKNDKNPREEFVREFTHAIAQTWLNIPHVIALFPDNRATFRFIFSSYTLALIFHELERGQSAHADLHLLTNAFPKAKEPQIISNVLIDPHDLWDFAEHARVISGFAEFPDEFANLELPPSTIMLCVYFIRSGQLQEWLNKTMADCKNLSEWTTENIFIAAGVHLTNHVFVDALSYTNVTQEHVSLTLDRSAVMREYSRTLFRAVSPISKNYA